MDGFSQRRGQLHCEDVSVVSLSERYGTPLYVYSRAALLARLREIQDGFRPAKPLICYSVKANSNLSILRLLARAGAGFDIVSGGELFRALRAGGRPPKIVFAGVGKSPREIADAIEAGILMFNAESEAELAAINRVAAEQGLVARVALRLNPDVDARTHAKTTTGVKETKFGIDIPRARRLFAERGRYAHVELCGLHVHLGSPICSVAPFKSALAKVKRFVRDVRACGATIATLNVGGGYAISYDGRAVIRPCDYARAILPAVKNLGVRLLLEPGRYVVGNSGILVSTVTYIKEGWMNRRFVILDAGMNDLLRPALYGSHQHIWPVKGPGSPLLGKGRRRGRAPKRPLVTVDIVGPICETSDSFAGARRLPSLKANELVAIFGAGAYGMSMGSNYNSRPRPCEVLVSGRRARVIRRRETYKDLVRGE